MAVTRPLKEGSVTTYQAKVAAGFPDILASEVDADLDTIYAAWNGNVGTANLVDGSVTYAKLAPDAQLWRDTGTALTPGTNFATRAVAAPTATVAGDANGVVLQAGARTIKARLITHPTLDAFNATLNLNAVLGTQDDATKASWFVQLRSDLDRFTLYRAPAGAPGSSSALLTVDATGLLTVGASTTNGKINLAPRCAIVSSGGTTGSTDFSCNPDSSVPSYDQTQSGWLWRLGTGPGNDWCNLYRRPPGTTSFSQQAMTIDSAGNFTILGGTATKASGTTWANPSDRRLKDDIEDYATGLAAILQLQPRTFVYNGKGGSTAGMRGYGFIADEVAPVMPETVGTRAGKLDAADEDETDIQTLDQSNLILALVNAVKELAARVDAR